MNFSAIKDRVYLRSLALGKTRSFFMEKDFCEADTFLLAPTNAPEVFIDPLMVEVQDHFTGEKTRRYLITSPELALKRLVANGVHQVYQLGKVFRDGEITKRHLPEFTMLEWYRAHAGLGDLIKDCEELMVALQDHIKDKIGIYREDLNLKSGFDKANLEDLWQRYAQIDLRTALEETLNGDANSLVRHVEKAGVILRPDATFEDAFHAVMTDKIEPNIGQDRPCVVMKWPSQMAMLANVCKDDQLFAERFEIYAKGLEIANAYQELADATEQKKRFESDNNARKSMNKIALPISKSFLRDLSCMPQTAGIALGFDRLLMLLINAKNIDEVIAFSWKSDHF